MFVIWDDSHSENHGEFESPVQVYEELKHRAELPWDEAPNRAPCRGWRKCGRKFVITEYDDRAMKTIVRRIPALRIWIDGPTWPPEFLQMFAND